jgi:hypothetical protein
MPRPLYPPPPTKRLGTYFVGGWVSPGLNGCRKSRPPPLPDCDFFCCLSVLHPYLVLCPYCPAFCVLSLLYNTHNTNIHAPDGIRTRNPSKRSAADSRLRPLDHWDRLGSNPRTVQPIASRYTDGAIPGP